MCTLEEKAFALFRKESTPEFKRHVLDVVKATIDSSPRITVKRLKGTMETLYFIQPEDVDGALSALLNVYGCITSFRVPEHGFRWKLYIRLQEIQTLLEEVLAEIVVEDILSYLQLEQIVISLFHQLRGVLLQAKRYMTL